MLILNYVRNEKKSIFQTNVSGDIVTIAGNYLWSTGFQDLQWCSLRKGHKRMKRLKDDKF